MPTLYNASHLTRRFLMYAGIAIAIFILLKILISVGSGIRNKYFPPPPPAPDKKYGALPSIAFEKPGVSDNFEYKIETSDGTLGKFVNVARVYQIEKPTETLTSLSRAKEKALALGFDGEPVKVAQSVFRWQDANQTLEIDIQYNSFTIRTALGTLPAYRGLSQKQASTLAKSFFSSPTLAPKDLNFDDASINFWAALDDKLIRTTSEQDANITRANFQRSVKNIYDRQTPIFEEDPDQPLVYLGASLDENRRETVTEANYYYWVLNSNDFSIYPVKSVNQAFDELKAGKGNILKKDTSDKTIEINKIGLYYFLNKNYQAYLQPVFVFQGDGFLAVVEAVIN